MSVETFGSRPLPLDKVSDQGRRILGDINRRVNWLLNGNSEPVRPQREKPEWVWARIVRDHRAQTLAINGRRGLGKTTLLLTLLAEWMEEGLPLETEKLGASSPNARDLKNDLSSTGGELRVHHILDFEAVPDSMPLLGWLLEPWGLLVEHLESMSTEHTSHNKQRDENLESLKEKYLGLFQRAVAGWSKGAHGASLLEQALDFRDITSGWIVLHDDWHNFIDVVIQRLIELAPGHQYRLNSRRGMVVLPIDDVDLQCERLPELLHALRLFSHQRVVYLLTADLDHATEVLTQDYLGRHRTVGRVVLSTDALDENSPLVQRAKELAEAQMEKTIPAAARFTVEPMTLATVLKARMLEREAVQSKLDQYVLNGDPALNLGSELAVLAESDPIGPICTWRRLEQSFEADDSIPNILHTMATGYVRTPSEEELPGIANASTSTGITTEKSTAVTGRPSANKSQKLLPPQKALRIADAGQLWVRTRLSTLSSEAGGGAICVGNKLDLAFGELHEGFREPENLYLALLLRDLKVVDAPNLVAHYLETFAWTRWRRNRNLPTVVYPWPFLRFPTLLQFHSALSIWPTLVQPLSDREVEESDLLVRWLELQVDWLLDSVGNVHPSHPKEGTTIENLVDGLIAAKLNKDQRRDVTEWLEKELFYMCLPEYRLRPEVQKALLVACDRLHEKIRGTKKPFVLSRSRRQEIAVSAHDVGRRSREALLRTKRGDFSTVGGLTIQEEEIIARRFLNSIDKDFQDCPALERLDKADRPFGSALRK